MSQTDTRFESVYDWAAHHDLYPWLLPLESRTQDPVDIATTVAAHLADLPDTQATFTFRDVDTPIHTEYYDSIVAFFGLREVARTSQRRYINPEYCHLGHHEPAITDREARRQFYERYRGSPLVDAAWFRTNFDLSERGFEAWLQRNDYHWGEQKRRNQARYGRTVWTLSQWLDRGLYSLAGALPGSERSITRWVDRHARQSDYEAPGRPERHRWFRKLNGEL